MRSDQEPITSVPNPGEDEDVALHQWQKDILHERARLIVEGKAEFIEWETAKKRIAEQISRADAYAEGVR